SWRPTKPPTSARRTTSNLFGNPILFNGFYSYWCATHIATDPDTGPGSPHDCGGLYAPTNAAGVILKDGNGAPLLTAYPGAITSTPFSIGSTSLKLLDLRLFDLTAKVELPNQLNPYDSTPAATTTPYQALVPWTGVRPGVGFPIPISGTRDRWISTDQLDFSGITTTILVDYLPQPNADGSVCVASATNPCDIKILAAETQDFLGDVFLCSAPNPANIAVTDYLNVGMYTSAGYILDWLKNHPGAADPAKCSIITRYSPFNNYPDFITSLTNGVKVNISQGSGFGRVVDVTIFDPTLTQ
ncbi:MAG: hypothetical protein ABIP89_17215, partial [Polyangiaceae bacterium]